MFASRLVMDSGSGAGFYALRLSCLTPVADHGPGMGAALTGSYRGWMVDALRETGWVLADGRTRTSLGGSWRRGSRRRGWGRFEEDGSGVVDGVEGVGEDVM